MAFTYETEGEDTLLKCLETWPFPRERCENYAKEYRKRRLTKLAEIMDDRASKVSYSWDDPATCPAYYYGDHAAWAWNQTRRHMMQLLSGQPGAFQAWLKSR
jgi:hypothetical protein